MLLQPHKTFIDETTRLNAVYWTFRYGLRAMNAASGTLPTPTPRERRNMGGKDGSRLLGSLRVAAVLHVCSAFEHALTSYFALCILYRPKAFPKTKTFRPAPDVLRDPAAFAELRGKAIAIADGEMKAEYTKRLQKFTTRFAINTSWVEKSLDRFQEVRHKVAHDQALDGADDPSLSSAEVIGAATKLKEADWQEMLGLFDKTIEQLDAEVALNVVTDSGAGLAVFRVLERKPDATLADIRRAVLYEWRPPPTPLRQGVPSDAPPEYGVRRGFPRRAFASCRHGEETWSEIERVSRWQTRCFNLTCVPWRTASSSST